MSQTMFVNDIPRAPAALQTNPMPEDESRRSRYSTYAEFWSGVQWSQKPKKRSDKQLVLNYARLVLRKSVSYTLGDPAQHAVSIAGSTDDTAAQEIEQLLSQALDSAGAHALDVAMLNDAAIYGESACKITWSAAANRVALSAIHPNQLNIALDPLDRA